MPIYEFKCRDCGKITEVLLRGVDNTPSACPYCGSGALEKLFSASHLVRGEGRAQGSTCCGREERCDKPPCSSEDGCQRGKRHE